MKYKILSPFLFTLLGLYAVGSVAHAQSSSWQARASGVSNDLNSIACPSDRICYIVGGAPFIGGSGVILKTDNGGDTWVSQSIPVTNPLRGVSCLSINLCYVAGDGGVLLKTTNGGASWTRLAANTPAAEQYYWSVFAIDATHVVAVGNGGKIFRTVNGGVSWSEASSGTFHNLTGVYFANGAIGWATGGGSLLKTINGGANWYPMSAGAGGFWWTPDAVTQDLVWFSGDSIAKSVNGALALAVQYSTPGVTFRGIDMVDANNGSAVGTGGYIRRTVNGGATWTTESSPTTVILRDVACPYANFCLAVGDDGVIIRKGGPLPPAGGPPPPASSGVVGPPPPPPQIMVNPSILQALGTRLFQDNLTPIQKNLIESKRHWGTKRIQGLSLNPQILQNNEIDFNLFANLNLRGILTRRDEKPDGTKIWKGTIQGKTGSNVRLVQVGNSIAGTIRTKEGVFSIRPSRGGGYTVQEIDLAKFPEDFHVITPQSGERLTATATPPPPASAAPVGIDVLVGYTTDVVALYDGVHPSVQAVAMNMIEDANEILENSNIDVRLRLARMHYVSANEEGFGGIARNGSISEALSYVASGIAADAAALRQVREDEQADLVTVLVSELDDFCGIGYQMDEENESTFADSAYSVVNVDCIDTHTFMHEVGHNMGAGHNAEDQITSGGEPMPSRYPYSYGYRTQKFGFRTMMAYKCEGDDDEDLCPRIPYFSNPDLRYGGHRIGTENEADNARTLTLTRWVVRNFNGGSEGGGDAPDTATSAAERFASSTGTSPHPRVLPGTFRYTLRTMEHAARSFFTLNPERRAELHIRYANEKLLEANELATQGKHDEATEHLAAFEKEVGKVEQATKKLLAKKGDTGKDLASKLLTSELKHQVFLNVLKNHAPDEKKEKFEQVKEKQAEKIKEVIETLNVQEKFDDTIQEVVKNLSEGRDEKQAQIEVLMHAKEKLPEQAKKIGDAIEKALEKAEETMPKKIEKVPEAQKPEPVPVLCAQILAPVCGGDGISYGNSCEAEQAGVKVVYKGACAKEAVEEIQKEELKTTVPTPSTEKCLLSKAFVCGKNGITYLNSCFAEEANVSVAYKGECTSVPAAPAVPTSKPPTVPTSELLCTQQYDPVCGEDGKTHSNACMAKLAGVAVAYKGECKIAVPLPVMVPTNESILPVGGAPPTVMIAQCNDGIDNDKDGYIDLKDSGCVDTQDDDESTMTTSPPAPAPTPTPTPPPTSEKVMPPTPPPSTIVVQCSDGADNDKDGYIDLKDSGCVDAQDDDESTMTISPPAPPPAPAPTPTPTPPPTNEKVLPPTAKLTTDKGATSITITSGSSMTLSWSTTDAASVTLDPGIGKVITSGSISVKPLKTTTYVLSASNSAGTVTSSLTVTVK